MATDLFGRGMDIERVNIVFNYDMPENSDTYLHRVRIQCININLMTWCWLNFRLPELVGLGQRASQLLLCQRSQMQRLSIAFKTDSK